MALSAKKNLALLNGPNTQLSAKLEADLDVQGHSVRRQGVIKVSHKVPGFTQKQDLKLAVGVDLDWPAGASRPVHSLLFQAKENNWGFHLRRKRCSLTYDL